jgi:hypothetical protein
MSQSENGFGSVLFAQITPFENSFLKINFTPKDDFYHKGYFYPL